MALDYSERDLWVPNTAHTHLYDSKQVSSANREETPPFSALKCSLV